MLEERKAESPTPKQVKSNTRKTFRLTLLFRAEIGVKVKRVNENLES